MGSVANVVSFLVLPSPSLVIRPPCNSQSPLGEGDFSVAFSCLKMNLKKTSAIVRNQGGGELAACISQIGVEVKHFVKHLGIRLGNVVEHEGSDGWGFTQGQVFARALQEAFHRAKIVPRLRLSFDERVFMLCSWIFPVVSWVAQVFNAPEVVVRQLKLIYHLILGTKSWSLTLPILAKPHSEGGQALLGPEIFLMHQAAAPYVSMLREPHKFPVKAVDEGGGLFEFRTPPPPPPSPPRDPPKFSNLSFFKLRFWGKVLLFFFFSCGPHCGRPKTYRTTSGRPRGAARNANVRPRSQRLSKSIPANGYKTHAARAIVRQWHGSSHEQLTQGKTTT